MNALSLFSGIGGIDLAGEWAGIKTVAMCEREPFCQKVLRKHWPDIHIYDDVCTLTKERLEADGIGTIDLIHGGYPCQPFSHAGERKGEADDRHLWPEVKRLLETVRPRWFVGENVAGHITLGLDDVLSDLGSIGYASQPVVIPAVSIGASHRRQRVFVIAHDERNGLQGVQFQEIQGIEGISRNTTYGSAEDWAKRSMLFEPKLRRTLDGIPDGVDRTRALGNAVVPDQIYPILAAIKQIDEVMQCNN